MRVIIIITANTQTNNIDDELIITNLSQPYNYII